MKKLIDILDYSLEDKQYTLDDFDLIYTKEEILNFFNNITIVKIKIDYNCISVLGNKEKYFIFESKSDADV